MLSLIFSGSTTWYTLMVRRSSRLFVGRNSVCIDGTFLLSLSHCIRIASFFYKRCQAILEVMAKLSYVALTLSHFHRLHPAKGCRAQAPSGIPR